VLLVIRVTEASDGYIVGIQKWHVLNQSEYCNIAPHDNYSMKACIGA
jgi:hypothetical protein